MDGEGAVVGVQNKRVVSSDGYYNLTWDFAERGPILPRTTVEYRLGRGADPLSADTDGDGLSDGQEVNVYRTTPTNADTDGDGLKDGEEVGRDTNPLATDSDGDGLLDGWEVAQGLDPVDASGENGASGDMDGDGLCNSDEQSLGTDPHAADSDGDGSRTSWRSATDLTRSMEATAESPRRTSRTGGFALTSTATTPPGA